MILHLLFLSVSTFAGPNAGDWSHYASNAGSSKYSELSQINPTNVQNLKVAWRWTTADQPILNSNPKLYTFINEATPIAIRGNLYVSTSMSQVAKIDGSTGKTIWVFDPQTYKNISPPNNGYVHRGVTYWESKDQATQRVYIGTGDGYLISIDAKTGKPDLRFGKSGRIDLLRDIHEDGTQWPFRFHYGVTSPVTICQGTIIVGSSNMDSVLLKKSAKGDVRGFDLLSGKMKWRFHTIPTGNEFGATTWKENSGDYSGNANVWTMMSADEKNGLVYLPVSTPTNDWYGGLRPGDNLFGESLVCLSCLDGVRQWHFQLVHHGLWDYDPPAAPNLFETTVNGKPVSAVAQITKQGFTFVFNRITGQPIWDILEKPVPSSHLEAISPTQPFPTKPSPFDRQGIKKEDFLSPETEQIANQYEWGPLYTPPTDQKKGTIALPGWIGGGSWAGAAISPETNVMFVSSITNPFVILLKKNWLLDYAREASPGLVTGFDDKPYKLPLFKPPYGRITAIDMNTGETLWQVPLGRGPRDEPKVAQAIKGTQWENRDLGWPRRGHLLLTKELLFAGQSGDLFISGTSPLLNAIKVTSVETPGEKNLKAINPRSGEVVFEVPLNVSPEGQEIPEAGGNANGALMTYMGADGNQYIVVPVGGANKRAELVALRLR